jgi:peptide/nickel transport system permease protein
MATLVLRRVLWMLPTLVLISMISFLIIELPPGDYLSSYLAARAATGETVDQAEIEVLRREAGLDQPFHWRYLHWMGGVVRGDLGRSYEHNKPVTSLIGERLLLTLVISLATLAFTWGMAIPIGIYSAVRQYSWFDYLFTFMGYIGLAVPNFLLAILFMYLGYALFGASAGGLFSPAYQNAAWSWARVGDLLAHLWVPVLVIGVSGTAGTIRILRGNLLDELRKQYVLTALAKGLPVWKVILKYPVRVALNPLVSTIGWVLPYIVSGSVIASVVLGLPTVGPLLLQALMNQDMLLAGSLVMLLSTLTVLGTLISDLLLLWLDPRIRLEGKGR